MTAHNKQAKVSSVLSDYDYANIQRTAAQADTALVFVNADSGEGYLAVDVRQPHRDRTILIR